LRYRFLFSTLAVVNIGVVKAGGFAFFAAARCAILRVFAQKCALQKVS
jgi:hypothetical protein